MRILYVTPRQCWPMTSGAKLRDFYFLKILSEQATVDLLGFAEAAAQDAFKELNKYSDAMLLKPPKRYSIGKLLRGALTTTPLPVINYYSREMAEEIRRRMDKNHYDAVHLDSIHMGRYYVEISKVLPQTPVFLNWHNIESELLQRYGERTTAFKSVYAKITASRLRAFEDVLLRDASGHFVCSDRERGLLAERVPAARIATIENGVDCPYFAATPKCDAPKRIVFVGSMNYHANIEAVRSFVDTVWPSVRQRFPALTFTIVGGNPPPAVVQLGAVEGVEVTGMVEDVRPYYSDALAAVVPLLTGGGTRLKILEAMAAGTPVVTTALGCEGLDVRDSCQLLLAEEAADWLHAFERLQDSSLRGAIIEKGRELVRSRYDWSVIGSNLRSTYASWLATNRS